MSFNGRILVPCINEHGTYRFATKVARTYPLKDNFIYHTNSCLVPRKLDAPFMQCI